MTEDSEPKAGKAPMIIAGVILLVMAGVLCLYQLRVTHVAIVTTLGKPKVVTKPGLHVRLPWPVQQVTRLDKRLQCLELTAKEIIPKTASMWSAASSRSGPWPIRRRSSTATELCSKPKRRCDR